MRARLATQCASLSLLLLLAAGCCCGYGYLPLLRDPSAAVQGQLRTAVREHERLIGEAPRGIWLPECAYFEGLDQQLAKAGLRYAIRSEEHT